MIQKSSKYEKSKETCGTNDLVHKKYLMTVKRSKSSCDYINLLV